MRGGDGAGVAAAVARKAQQTAKRLGSDALNEIAELREEFEAVRAEEVIAMRKSQQSPPDVKLYAIFEATEIELGDLVAIATEQVVASMAVRAGFSVISNLPILHSTSEFLSWAEKRQ